MSPRKLRSPSVFLVTGVLGATILILLCACAMRPQSIGIISDHVPTQQIREQSNPENPLGGPSAYTDDERLFVTLSGSSSCPEIPVALETIDSKLFAIDVLATGGPDCTADLTTVTYEIDVPGVPEQLLIRSEWGETRITVVAEDSRPPK